MMSGKKYKTLLSVGILLCLLTLVEPQLTFEEITRNNCGENEGLPENLSCANVQTGINGTGGSCLPSSALCDGTNQCSSGEDEGALSVLNSLECNVGGKIKCIANLYIISKIKLYDSNLVAFSGLVV